MKVTGSRRLGNRMIEFEGKKIFLDEKSWEAGHEAAWKGKSPEDIQEIVAFGGFGQPWACPMSFAVGYTDGVEDIGRQIAHQQDVVRSVYNF